MGDVRNSVMFKYYPINIKNCWGTECMWGLGSKGREDVLTPINDFDCLT